MAGFANKLEASIEKESKPNSKINNKNSKASGLSDSKSKAGGKLELKPASKGASKPTKKESSSSSSGNSKNTKSSGSGDKKNKYKDEEVESWDEFDLNSKLSTPSSSSSSKSNNKRSSKSGSSASQSKKTPTPSKSSNSNVSSSNKPNNNNKKVEDVETWDDIEFPSTPSKPNPSSSSSNKNNQKRSSASNKATEDKRQSRSSQSNNKPTSSSNNKAAKPPVEEEIESWDDIEIPSIISTKSASARNNNKESTSSSSTNNKSPVLAGNKGKVAVQEEEIESWDDIEIPSIPNTKSPSPRIDDKEKDKVALRKSPTRMPGGANKRASTGKRTPLSHSIQNEGSWDDDWSDVKPATLSASPNPSTLPQSPRVIYSIFLTFAFLLLPCSFLFPPLLLPLSSSIFLFPLASLPFSLPSSSLPSLSFTLRFTPSQSSLINHG